MSECSGDLQADLRTDSQTELSDDGVGYSTYDLAVELQIESVDDSLSELPTDLKSESHSELRNADQSLWSCAGQ